MLAGFGVLIALSSLGFAGYMISDVDRSPRIAPVGEFFSHIGESRELYGVLALRSG